MAVKKRFFIIPAALAALVLLVLLFTGAFKNGDDTAGVSGKPAFYTVEAASQNEVIEVSGNVVPVDDVVLSFPVGGELTALNVKAGDLVKKGSLVARLDDLQERYNLKALDFQIDQERFSSSGMAKELRVLERELLVRKLEQRKLFASITGMVSEVYVEAGENPASGTPIMKIIDLSALKATVEIDELDVPGLKMGQSVAFFFDALPDLEVTGAVSSIPIEGRVTNQGLAVVDVEVKIEKPRPEILPSYSFTGELLVSEEEKILILDKKGVSKRGEQAFVIFAPKKNGALKAQEKPAGNNGGLNKKTVKVEDYNATHYRIVSGLKEGAVVMDMSSLPQNGAGGNGKSGGGIPFFRGGGRK